MNNLSMTELEARRSAVLKQLGRVGPLVGGSLAVVHCKCGKPTCRCARGERHRSVILCSKVSGRSKIVHVPKGLEEQVAEWNAEHKRVKTLLKQISDLSEQIIRGYVRSQRAKPTGRGLRVVEPTEGPGEA